VLAEKRRVKKAKDCEDQTESAALNKCARLPCKQNQDKNTIESCDMFLGFVCACVAIKGSDNKHLLSPSGSFLFLGITADVHVVKFINHG
jgi:hypothetical protein